MDTTAPPPTSEAPQPGGEQPATRHHPFRPRRSRHGVLGGVCGGLSVATGVDISLVRLAFIITGIAGFGVLAYIILLFVLPREDPEHGVLLTPAPPEVARWLRAALLVVPLLSITGWAGFGSGPFAWDWWHHDRGSGVGLGIVIVLIGAGIIWLRRRGDRREAAEPQPSVTSERSQERPPWWAAPTPTNEPVPTVPSSSLATERRAPAVSPSEPSTGAALVLARISAWIAILGAVVIAGVTITLERLGVLSIMAPVLLAIVAVAAVAVLVFVTVESRRPWTLLVVQTVVLVPVLLGLVLGRWVGGLGDRVEVPVSLTSVRPDYRLAIGHLELDLHRLPLDGKTLNVAADTRIGLLDVVVPADARITLDAHVGVGKLDVFDQSRNGTSLDQHVDDSPASTRGRINLKVDMAIGQVRVCRATASSRATTCPEVLAGG